MVITLDAHMSIVSRGVNRWQYWWWRNLICTLYCNFWTTGQLCCCYLIWWQSLCIWDELKDMTIFFPAASCLLCPSLSLNVHSQQQSVKREYLFQHHFQFLFYVYFFNWLFCSSSILVFFSYHASDIPLVLNRCTGDITPQFHDSLSVDSELHTFWSVFGLDTFLDSQHIVNIAHDRNNPIVLGDKWLIPPEFEERWRQSMRTDIIRDSYCLDTVPVPSSSTSSQTPPLT